ncbi:MAG TPA: serine hydrolase [Cyclobacteriaceae bacterium]|nr:serine hydrolase [Cyclobacteriaceae bacterium]
MKIRRTGILWAISICFFISCDKFSDPSLNYIYTIPEHVSEDFPVSSLESEKVNEALITQMTDLIIRDEYKRIDGVLILRNNKLIYENYFHGYSKDVLHNIYSSAKSNTSLLTGIAVEKGFIKDVNNPILPMLSEYTIQNPDPRKNRITVEHLLNMSAGLNCDDYYQNTETQMRGAEDWVKFTLDLPMSYEPGTHPSYCTGGVVVLGRIIENQSKMTLQEFAARYLFNPLHITDYKWEIMPDGKASGGGIFFLRPRDMAKIGSLMLNDGVWNGQQIVLKQWVEKCRQNFVKIPGLFNQKFPQKLILLCSC